jgi:hypothetical protein
LSRWADRWWFSYLLFLCRFICLCKSIVSSHYGFVALRLSGFEAAITANHSRGPVSVQITQWE